MSSQTSNDLADVSLLDLFRMEVEAQAAVMADGLIALEREPAATHRLEELMRGAHSLKGAARIVNRDSAVRVAHAMEDCFVAAQRDKAVLHEQQIDLLLRGVDLLIRAATVSESGLKIWEKEHAKEIDELTHSFSAPQKKRIEKPVVASAPAPPTEAPPTETPRVDIPKQATEPSKTGPTAGRAVRVAPENLNRLLGLAGESVVAARWLDGFASNLRRVKRLQAGLAQSLNNVSQTLAEVSLSERAQGQLGELKNKAATAQQAVATQLEELELFDRRFINLSKRLYQEVLDCRMRPLSDGVQGLARMVRDAARSLGKEIDFEIVGQSTPVDRDVLQRIEAPLGHLLRNAVDHGIETPAERLRIGKAREASIRLEGRHAAGMLLIEVADDGRGIDTEAIRSAVVRKKLSTPEVAGQLTEAELIEFLFLPGFTMKEAVTEISGRGVGLDVVQTMIKEVGGSVRVFSQPGQGTTFQLHLPLTLSVLRTLLVEIGGEPYAFPIARVTNTLKVAREKVESIEGREHFAFGEQQVGLVTAHQVLGLEKPYSGNGELPVIVLGEKNARYGVVVDRLLGEHELVVRPLDPRLGKIKDISAAALMPDQSPVLIIDVEDMSRSIENVVSGGRLAHVSQDRAAGAEKMRKRVLVVDDSLTVRELERKLIDSRGYHVEVAVDGMDAWNAVRTGHYDLVVTDVDMPRLDGIELVTLIKKDPRLNSLPVMIISYKDREEDRRRGLEAGADYYLTKGSFHDATLLRAVSDLIGEAEA